MAEQHVLDEAEKRTRITFVSVAFILLSVIILALVYLVTGTSTAATATLSFAGGVSNIFLPLHPATGLYHSASEYVSGL